jgi:DNA-binding transcriptional regulator YiaG
MTEQMHFAHVDCDDQPPVQYRACGLDNVYLRSGYTIKERHGERYMAVKDADELHAAIALHLASRKKVLRGQEVRFLRKFLEMTQAELASELGVTDQTVARYEKGESSFDGPVDMLLRLLVIGKIAGAAINVEETVRKVRQTDSPANDALTLDHDSDGWKVAA